MQRERVSMIFMNYVTILGWLITLGSIPFIRGLHHIPVFIILVVFMYVIEQFPMPLWKGNTSLSFSILYTIYRFYGLSMALLILCITVFVANLVQKRPINVALFNPSQLAISLFISIKLTTWIMSYDVFSPLQRIPLEIVKVSIVIFSYYLISNIMVDLVFLMKSKGYPLKKWKQKTLTEALIGTISLFYILLMSILGHQDRGKIDFFSYFFFFSPLVAASLLGSIIVRLQREKNRLNSLFSITSKLNKGVTSDNWLETVIEELTDFLDFDVSVLLAINKSSWESWEISHAYGITKEEMTEKLNDDIINDLKKIKKSELLTKKNVNPGPADHLFDEDKYSFVYSPLLVEEEWIGMWIIGRSRPYFFRKEDVPSIKIIANQLSMVKKSRRLIAEQEKHKILEERNRIAREIHDGIAQILAGVVLSLETSKKKFHNQPEDALKLIASSIDKLRLSLTDVRESIYALRPNPVEYNSLIEAIKWFGKQIEVEHSIKVNFEIRGTTHPLSTGAEKTLYEIGVECLRNSVKHANATKIDILISYQKDQILLKVKDNGVGFSLLDAMITAKERPHFGIINMNDLAEKIGASLQIDSKPGFGTEIKCFVPYLDMKRGVLNHDQRHAGG